MGVEHFNGYHEIVQYQDRSHILVYLNDEPTDYPTHWHSPLEILMPVENIYTASIGNRTFRLEPSDILFVAPNVYHAYEAPPEGRRYFVLIDLAVVSGIPGLRQILSLISPTVLFTASNSPQVHSQLEKMLLELCGAYFHRDQLLVTPTDEEVRKGKPTQVDLLEPVIYSHIVEMLVLAARNYATADRPAPPMSRNRQQEYINKMTMVCSYIDEHCTEDLSLDQLSGMINFSKYHFSRLFREFTNESFYKYVNRKRIEYACQLLAGQSLSVTETALASGYSNTSSFIRMFKSAMGCTPRQYRDMADGRAQARPEDRQDS